MNALNNNNGFTFIEVMVALVILGIGISLLFTMQTTAIRGNASAMTTTELSTRTAAFLEHIVGAEYTDDILEDTNGDGTGQDGDLNGQDDENIDDIENFGLHEILSAADHCEVIDGPTDVCDDTDNQTTISWNIAVDVPAPNMKTVHVIVVTTKNVFVLTKEHDRKKKVEFEYYKDDVI